MVNVTEEFLEFISEGALAIEVWGHRCTGNGSSVWEVDSLHAKTRTLRDRYKQITHKCFHQLSKGFLILVHKIQFGEATISFCGDVFVGGMR